MELRQFRVAVDLDHPLEQRTGHAVVTVTGPVGEPGHDGPEPAVAIGLDDLPSQPELLAVVPLGCAETQHQVREIDVPLMRRHVRALAHVTHVAEVAVVDDLPVHLARHAVEFAGGRLVDRIEQRRKRVAQTEAATAAVADIEDAFEFRIQRFVRGEFGVAPIERMADRRIETALAGLFRVQIGLTGRRGFAHRHSQCVTGGANRARRRFGFEGCTRRRRRRRVRNVRTGAIPRPQPTPA